MKTLFTFLSTSIYKHKFLYFIASLLLAVLAFFPAKKIKVDSSFTSLLRQDHPVILNLDKITKYYGGIGSLILVVRSNDYEKGVRFVKTIVPKIEEHKDVRYVDYKKPTEFIKNNFLLYLERPDLNTLYNRLFKKLDYERQKHSPTSSLISLIDEIADPGFQYKDIAQKYQKKYNISFDSKKAKQNANGFFHKESIDNNKTWQTFVILIKPSQSSVDMGFSKYIVQEIKTIINNHKPASFQSEITTQFTGRYVKKEDMLKRLVADVKKVSLIAGLSVLFILIVYFRSFWPTVMVFTALIVGLIYTFGLTQLIFVKLNLVTSMLIAILFGLGIDFGIHYLVRYREERQKGSSIEKSFQAMVSYTGLASFTSAITTVLAFLVLIMSGFRAFVEFGVIAGIGVFSIFVSMTLLLSSFMLIVESSIGLKFTKKSINLKLPKQLYQKPERLVISSIFLVLLSSWGLSQVNFDYNFTKLFSYKNIASFDLDKEVNKMFQASLTPSVILADNVEEEKKIIAAIRDNITLNSKSSDARLDKVIALSTFLPPNQKLRFEKVKDIQRLIRKMRKYKPLFNKKQKEKFQGLESVLNTRIITTERLPDTIKNSFRGVDKSQDKRIVLVFPKADFNQGKQVLQFAKQVNEIKVDGKPLNLASDSLVFAEVMTVVQNEGYIILLYCFIGVFILIFFNFRKLEISLIVISPLLCGILWMAGMMGILNVKLDFFNVIMFPIIIGIGIDSSVHIYSRYLESKDIVFSVRNTGEAVALSSITTFAGFGALSLSESQGMSSMGNVAIIGIVSTYIASTMLLPGIVLMIENLKKKNTHDED